MIFKISPSNLGDLIIFPNQPMILTKLIMQKSLIQYISVEYDFSFSDLEILPLPFFLAFNKRLNSANVGLLVSSR